MKRILLMVASLVLTGGIYAAELKWANNYDDALAQAKKDKKLIMVDIYTDWCGWCKKLDKDVYSNKDVQAKLEKSFVVVKINPEKSQKNAKLSKEFGTTGFPHIVFLDASGKKISEIGGYQPADAFGQSLDAVIKQAKK